MRFLSAFVNAENPLKLCSLKTLPPSTEKYFEKNPQIASPFTSLGIKQQVFGSRQ